MSTELMETTSVLNKWNLSDDDDYNDNEDIVDEEPESHLLEEKERLIERIKQLAKSESYCLELKEVPRYVSKKQIEDFFGVHEQGKMEIEDPDPKNKRDVVVTFYDVNDFCDALVKNGRNIVSYNFDVSYNPNINRKNNGRGRGGHGHGHGHRDTRDNYSNNNRKNEGERGGNRNSRDRSGDVRNQNSSERSFATPQYSVRGDDRRSYHRDDDSSRHEGPRNMNNGPRNMHNGSRDMHDGQKPYRHDRGGNNMNSGRSDGHQSAYVSVGKGRASISKQTDSSVIHKSANRFGNLSESD